MNYSSSPLPPMMVPPPLPPRGIPPPGLPPPPLPPFPSHPPFLPPINTTVPPPVILYPPPVPPFLLTGSDSALFNPIKDKFELLKEQLKQRYDHKKHSKNIYNLKISTIKQKLNRTSYLIRQLEGQVNCLQITCKSLPDEEWQIRCKEVENLKSELSELMESLDKPESIKEILRVVRTRKKKLQYKKRKKKQWQEKKKEAKLNAERENRRIDLWLEKMKDEVARAKREEDVKREADMVLSDVTSKKVEAKRMLNLLNSLAKLRAARAQNHPVGQSDVGSEIFNKVIERLKKMWLDQIKGYNVEEQGLKVMLEHAEEERISVEVAEFRKNLKAWNRVIFGSSNTTYSQSLQEFIHTRRDWDKFIATEDTLMASRIPTGWVLPSEPSSEEWGKLLK